MNSKEKWEYFSDRLETTWNVYHECMAKFNENFWEKRKLLLESKNSEQYNDYLREIHFPYINTLNSAMLIAFISLTEYVITDIANEVERKKLKTQNCMETVFLFLKNKLNLGKRNRQKGNWLKKKIDILNKHGFKIDKNSEDIRFLHYYIKIRNCVVHNGWKISNQNKKGQRRLKEAIKAINKYAEGGNYIMLDDKEDCLIIKGDLIPDVVVRSENLIEELLEKINFKNKDDR